MSQDLEQEETELGRVGADAPRAHSRPVADVFIDETQLPKGCLLPLVERSVKVPVVVKSGPKKGHVEHIEKVYRGVLVGMGELTPDELIAAAERANGVEAKAGMCQIVAMIRQVNGRQVKFDVDEGSDIFEAVGMKGQSILTAAYRKIAQADPEAVGLMLTAFRWDR